MIYYIHKYKKGENFKADGFKQLEKLEQFEEYE